MLAATAAHLCRFFLSSYYEPRASPPFSPPALLPPHNPAFSSSTSLFPLAPSFPAARRRRGTPRPFPARLPSPLPPSPVADSFLLGARLRSPGASGDGRGQGGGGGVGVSTAPEDLGRDGEVFRKTLRLVECAMFASVSALAYLLSNSLALENYLGCFFALPIVISSMRWGLAAGRKTMVATAVLLLALAGPVKASTYLLMHGLLGFTMGSLWRLQVDWGLSILLCSLVRAMGAVGFVLVSSFLIRENIFSIITINMHATLSYMCSSIGISMPTMNAIYATFGVLLMINCGFLVLLLHILYAVFLTKLGMKDSLRLPRWLEKAV